MDGLVAHQCLAGGPRLAASSHIITSRLSATLYHWWIMWTNVRLSRVLTCLTMRPLVNMAGTSTSAVYRGGPWRTALASGTALAIGSRRHCRRLFCCMLRSHHVMV